MNFPTANNTPKIKIGITNSDTILKTSIFILLLILIF